MESGTPPRGRFDATVEFNQPLCREHFLLRLRVTGAFPPTQPGQFIQLGCAPPEVDCESRDLEWRPEAPPHPSQRELCQPTAMLRRPFSLAGREGNSLEIVHRVVGVGTRWLSERKPGDTVDLIGPLGNRFELPVAKSLALLVGGGVGLPPMFYLAQALGAAGWDAIAFIGALAQDLLPVTFDPRCPVDESGLPTHSVLQFAKHNCPCVVTTDDGSLGLPGRITAGLEGVLQRLSPQDAARAVIYTCGPEPMMHAVAKLASTHNIDCQVCLEQAMACGMGTCQSCVVKIEDPLRPQATTPQGRPWRFRLACTDGPVFDAPSVVW